MQDVEKTEIQSQTVQNAAAAGIGSDRCTGCWWQFW